MAMMKKLNLGCGYDKREGFLNVDLNDFHSPDLVGDVCSLPALASGDFDYILAQDVLEHLEREKTLVALAEWSRLLAAGGTLHIRVPSLVDMFELLARPENRPWHQAEKIIHLIYGTQKYNGDYHLAGFTAELLVEYFRQVGLVVACASLMDEWLFDIRVVHADKEVGASEIVHRAYFEVLGRPVDVDGLSFFAPQVESREMSEEALRQTLSATREFQSINSRMRYLRHSS